MVKRYVERIVKLSKDQLISVNGGDVEYLGNTGIYENAVVNRDKPAAHRIGEWSKLIAGLRKSIENNMNWLLGRGGWKLLEPTEFVGDRPVTHFGIADERFDKLDPIKQALVHDLVEATDLCFHAERAISNGNAPVAAAFAYTLGRTIERCAVRHRESQAAKGNRRDKQSRENVNKQKAAAESRRQKWQADVATEVERQLTSGDKANYTKACRIVSEAEGCSLRTITNAVPNRWTKRGQSE